jgi:hypothetical protein
MITQNMVPGILSSSASVVRRASLKIQLEAVPFSCPAEPAGLF